MRRFSIRSLMAVVVVAAVAVAALRNADDYWASGMILATPTLFGVALIGALCGGERARARRLGFAILGGGYFALALMGPAGRSESRLPTSQLLTYVHQQVVPTVTGTYIINAVATVAGTGTSPAPATGAAPLYVVTSPPAGQGTSSNLVVTGRWKSLLPGAANYEAFSIVGHCLFALLAGVLGGTVAVWFRRRRERAEAAASASPPTE